METCPLCPFTAATFRGIGIHLGLSHPGDGPLARFLRFTRQEGECLRWTGQIDNFGYGHFSVGKRQVVAHRWHYEMVVGPITDSLVVDHLCRVRDCVEIKHLEVVTQRENLRRSANHVGHNITKTTCNNGHEYTPDSVRLVHRGSHVERVCKPCKAEWVARSRAARKK